MNNDAPGNGLNTLGVQHQAKQLGEPQNWFADCRTTNFVDNCYFLFTFQVLICFQTRIGDDV